MDASRFVRLFRIGRNEAVRIPSELEMPGSEVRIYGASSWPRHVDGTEVTDAPAETVDLADC